MDGFDIDAPLVCEGVVGDGCGGGRIFFVKDAKLWVFDPVTKEEHLLFESATGVVRIFKKGCSVFLQKEGQFLEFDLQTFTCTEVQNENVAKN
jgi:hypothetical protein